MDSICHSIKELTTQLRNAREHSCDKAIVVLVDWLLGSLPLAQRLNACIAAIRVGKGALQRYGHMPRDTEGETKLYEEDSSMNMGY